MDTLVRYAVLTIHILANCNYQLPLAEPFETSMPDALQCTAPRVSDTDLLRYHLILKARYRRPQ